MPSRGIDLGEAVRAGRAAMGQADDGRFFDWGIPVLYTHNPQTIVFEGDTKAPERLPTTNTGGRAAHNIPTPQLLGADKPRPRPAHKATSVAIVDIDARAGFLAEVIKQANEAQHYYEFRLAYLPVPSGVVRGARNSSVRDDARLAFERGAWAL